MPWRPPYEDVNATFAPTYNVDDDAVLLSNLLEQLTLADVIQVGLTGLLATVALVTFFELKRRTRSARRMIFCPRMVWEGEVEAVSKRHGGDYAAQPRRRVGEVRTFDWVRATLFERTDADVLKHAGLEMYVYLRFVRLCLRGGLGALLRGDLGALRRHRLRGGERLARAVRRDSDSQWERAVVTNFIISPSLSRRRKVLAVAGVGAWRTPLLLGVFADRSPRRSRPPKVLRGAGRARRRALPAPPVRDLQHGWGCNARVMLWPRRRAAFSAGISGIITQAPSTPASGCFSYWLG